jgi:hypothetical protein
VEKNSSSAAKEDKKEDKKEITSVSEDDAEDNELRDRKNIDYLVRILKSFGASGNKTIGELANAVGTTPKNVGRYLEIIDKQPQFSIVATRDGKNVYYDLASTISPVLPLRLTPTESAQFFPDGKVRFGAIANTEFGNKYHRGDALHSYYHLLSEEGIRLVLLCGDILAGPPSIKNEEELIFGDMERQIKHFVKNFPRRKDITTLFLTSNYHEGGFIKKEKINIGEEIQRVARENNRNDLRYVGHIKQDMIMNVEGKDARIRIGHLMGAIPYAKSYPLQKMIESIQGGTKPHMMVVGHLYHLEQLFERGIWGYQVGSFIDQTPSMLNARQGTDVGGYIFTLKRPSEKEYTKQGFPRGQFKVQAQQVTFFNAEYYKKRNLERKSR